MAFLLIFAVSLIIYLIGGLLAPKPVKSREKTSMYACGEKMVSNRFSINITFYKYLVYFIILDSSAVILVFSSLAVNIASLVPLMIYFLILLVAVLLLEAGGE